LAETVDLEETLKVNRNNLELGYMSQDTFDKLNRLISSKLDESSIKDIPIAAENDAAVLSRNILKSLVIAGGLLFSSFNATGQDSQEDSKEAIVRNIQMDDVSAKEVRIMVKSHMQYIVDNNGVILHPQNDDRDAWKKYLASFKSKKGYDNNIDTILSSPAIFESFLHYYTTGFIQAINTTGIGVLNNLKNLEIIPEILGRDNNFESDKGYTAKAIQLRSFFKHEWANFIIAVANKDIEAQKVYSKRIVEKSATIDPRMTKMIESIVEAAQDFDDVDKVKKVLDDWMIFNKDFLIPQDFYGHLTFESLVDKRSGAKKQYYFAVISYIERQEIREVNDKKKISIIYGRKVDGVNMVGSVGHSIEGEGVVFINVVEVEDEVAKVRNTLNGNPYILLEEGQVSAPRITQLIRELYKGMSDEEIQDLIEDGLRAHELTHKSLELSGENFPKDETYGMSKAAWERQKESFKRSVAHEVAAYSAQMGVNANSS
jgi:hypothetical protein